MNELIAVAFAAAIFFVGSLQISYYASYRTLYLTPIRYARCVLSIAVNQAPLFFKGRGQRGGNVNIVGRILPQNKKSIRLDAFSFVGVDGFEPPTLCL